MTNDFNFKLASKIAEERFDNGIKETFIVFDDKNSYKSYVEDHIKYSEIKVNGTTKKIKVGLLNNFDEWGK